MSIAEFYSIHLIRWVFLAFIWAILAGVLVVYRIWRNKHSHKFTVWIHLCCYVSTFHTGVVIFSHVCKNIYSGDRKLFLLTRTRFVNTSKIIYDCLKVFFSYKFMLNIVKCTIFAWNVFWRARTISSNAALYDFWRIDCIDNMILPRTHAA